MNTTLIILSILLIIIHAIIMAFGIVRKSPTRKHFSRYEIAVPAIGIIFTIILLVSHILDQYILIPERLYMWCQGGGFSMSYFCFALMFVPFAIRFNDTPLLPYPWNQITKYGIAAFSGLGIILSIVLGQLV